MLSIFLGLMSALVWGAADFAGGLASRRSGAFQVVLVAEVAGLAILAAVAAFMQEPFFGWTAWLWCSLAGAIGSTGLVLLFRALASGRMSLATPVSALVAALLPAVAGSFLEDLPGPLTFLGFALALAAIWFVSRPQRGEAEANLRIADLSLPLTAGLCFGLYFIFVHQGNRESVIWPMLASRAGGSLIMLVFLGFTRQPWKPARAALPLVLLNAVLDVGGNAFFILADQVGRMDVAAVLSSLYPGSTVLLAWLLLKEHLTRPQWAGILLALLAIVLITI